jgi:RNA polymerase sigma-70 factor (ECF subfamily)
MDHPQLTELIRRAQAGNSPAFAELVDLHYDTIHRFAWRWCGHRTDAEDIAQQSCIKLAQNLRQFRFQSAFSSWLYRLVIHCAQDWLRSQQRHLHGALPENEPAFDSGRAEDAIELLQLLEQLGGMGPGMQETALLVHAEGLSHAEAGEVLGVSESTISWRIHTMRKHMNRREQLANGTA